MSLKNLSILTVTLFLGALAVYFSENYRSATLMRGSYFVKSLDVKTVNKIDLKFEGDKEISLTRDQEHFTLGSHKSYPAKTSKVNDLIYQIASIQVKEKVGSDISVETLKKYGLTEKTKSYKVEIYNGKGEKTQSFFVGKSVKNQGRYLMKEGESEVYISDGSLWIDSSYKDFISRVILDVGEDSIQKVIVNAGQKMEIEQEEDEIKLVQPAKDAKKEKLKKYVKGFSGTQFEDFFRIDDSKISKINFDKSVQIKLKNKLVYDLKLGEQEGEYFVKAKALADEIPNKVVLSQDADKSELEGVGHLIEARQAADKFNLEKATWVYRIDKSNYEKLLKEPKELM